MVRLHHDHICSVYRHWKTITKGSSVQTKVLLFEDAHCDYWKRRISYGQWPQAVQQQDNAYEMSFWPEYSGMIRGDIVILYGEEYKIDDVVPNFRRGTMDNYQVFVSKTGTWS